MGCAPPVKYWNKQRGAQTFSGSDGRGETLRIKKGGSGRGEGLRE